MTRRWHQAAAAVACTMALMGGSGARAQSVQPIAPVAWGALSVPQRTTLAPLAPEWARLTPVVQHKWIEIAGKLPTMSVEQQQRVHERMREWARLSPEQRTEARLNFQQFRQWGGADKQARWEAYQALPLEERQALAAKAARAASAPASIPASPTHLLRKAPLGAMVPKSNMVKEGPVPAAQALRPVAPAVVQARPGVTTQWVGVKQPSPPDHQKAGQPKIAAGPGMVDRSTLLPKHGPQAAGVAAPHKPPGVARAGAASAVSPAASSVVVAAPSVVGAASAASGVGAAAMPVAASAVASVAN
jgi:Protein of unknown function (DUF3106)